VSANNEKQLFENLAIEHMDSLSWGNAASAEGTVQQTYASAFCTFEMK